MNQALWDGAPDVVDGGPQRWAGGARAPTVSISYAAMYANSRSAVRSDGETAATDLTHEIRVAERLQAEHRGTHPRTREKCAHP